MRKFLLLIMLLVSTSAFANVVIKINFTGESPNNRYFLCLTNAGCLSIQDGQKGKPYPLDHHFGVRGIYILDAADNMRLSPQPIPPSCNLKGLDNVTLTFSGDLRSYPQGLVVIDNLNCSVEKSG